MSISTLPAPAPATTPHLVVSSSLDEASGPAREASRFRVVLLGVIAIGAAYVYWHLGRGLLPHDDGAIGHAAERILQGDLPHRDFDDIYTGGLAWLNAAAFRVLGTSMWSMRLVLLAAFVAWIPAVFYIASRFGGLLSSALVTTLAIVWSVPNYVAPMPSWYNLFLATAGVALLMRHLERPHAGWLVAAGIVGGLSVLMKVVGLYYVAGVLLYLVHESHAAARHRAGVNPDAAPAYATFVTASLGVFVAALVMLVRYQLLAAEVLHFVVPGAMIAVFLAHQEWTRPAGASRLRAALLARRVLPFLLGVVIPLAIFAAPYVASASVHALLNGVFILPTRRFGMATRHAAPLITLLALIPFAVVGLVARTATASRIRVLPWALAGMMGLVAWLAGNDGQLYRLPWAALYNIVPVTTAAALFTMTRRRETQDDVRLMLLVAVTAMCSLVQFPFAAPIYLCYVLPLAWLTVLALHARVRAIPAPVMAVMAGFFIVFAVTRVNTSSLMAMGVQYVPYEATLALPLDRAGVNAPVKEQRDFVAIARLLGEHARGGYTWASPDSPEMYFLTGLRNPTRSLFDFFDDPDHRDARILSTLDAHAITAIVLNRNPEFSLPISNHMYDALVVRYPWSVDVGHYQVRWRR